MEKRPSYPVMLEVDPPAQQNRLAVFFRVLLVIPHLVILYFLTVAQVVVTLIAWVAILFTGSYPEGMLRFSTNVLHWSARVNGYMHLLTGRYPPFALGEDAAYAVRLQAATSPDNRNRLTTFFRVLLAIPHLIIVGFLDAAMSIVVSIVVFIAWFAALFTGEVPAGLHRFIAGVWRWQLRLNAYIFLLVDDYPPFSFE